MKDLQEATEKICELKGSLLVLDTSSQGRADEVVTLLVESLPGLSVSTANLFAAVQPGNSLWRIARRVYGDGPKYTEIYEANRSQIKDPDLIYPGQIFRLPEQGG